MKTYESKSTAQLTTADLRQAAAEADANRDVAVAYRVMENGREAGEALHYPSEGVLVESRGQGTTWTQLQSSRTPPGRG